MTGFGLVPTSPRDEAAISSAKLLASYVRNRTGTARPISESRWAEEIARIKAPKNEVKETILWLIANAHGANIPVVASGTTLRSNYERIRKLMSQSVQPTDKASVISERLGRMHWEGFTREDELRAIEISLIRYREWLSRLADITGDFAGYVRSVAPPAEGFVTDWMFAAHCSFNRLQGRWRGTLCDFAFYAKHPRFREMGEQWAVDYTGKADSWKTLMNRILNESGQEIRKGREANPDGDDSRSVSAWGSGLEVEL